MAPLSLRLQGPQVQEGYKSLAALAWYVRLIL